MFVYFGYAPDVELFDEFVEEPLVGQLDEFCRFCRFLITTSVPFCRKTMLRPSKTSCTKPEAALPEISTSELSETTTGLACKLCAHIGLSTIAETSGDTIGPPALKEYPVLPVGVATR